MTRLDRARIALAYEYLRYRSRFERDDEWTAVSHHEAWGMVYKSAGALPRPLRVVVAEELYVGDARLIRARLALYLRALMRADAGDCGPWRVTYSPDYWRRTVERRIRPLWESAPAHRGTA